MALTFLNPIQKYTIACAGNAHLSFSAQSPRVVQLDERRSRGGKTPLALKSVTDKSGLENGVFCHTGRGSDCRFYLFIFADKHEKHFKIASYHTTSIASKAKAQNSVFWGSFISKPRKPEGRAGLVASGCSRFPQPLMLSLNLS